MKILTTESKNKWYLTTSAILFTIVAVAHLGLIIFQLQITIGNYEIPYELNGIIVVAMGYLASRGFMSAHKL